MDLVYTGLRPGEKLSEELLDNDEDFLSTGYEKLLMLRTASSHNGVVPAVEQLLQDVHDMDGAQVRSRLQDLVPEYHPAGVEAREPVPHSQGTERV